jgi:hypothetical protein
MMALVDDDDIPWSGIHDLLEVLAVNARGGYWR